MPPSDAPPARPSSALKPNASFKKPAEAPPSRPKKPELPLADPSPTPAPVPTPVPETTTLPAAAAGGDGTDGVLRVRDEDPYDNFGSYNDRVEDMSEEYEASRERSASIDFDDNASVSSSSVYEEVCMGLDISAGDISLSDVSMSLLPPAPPPLPTFDASTSASAAPVAAACAPASGSSSASAPPPPPPPGMPSLSAQRVSGGAEGSGELSGMIAAVKLRNVPKEESHYARFEQRKKSQQQDNPFWSIMSAHIQKLRDSVRVPGDSDSEGSGFESWEDD